MEIRYLLLPVFVVFLNSVSAQPQTDQVKDVPVSWTENLAGDFSFKDQWAYSEGIYRNEAGQLTCDGLCPPGADLMKDSYGNIFKDSLAAFYKLVDTTHFFYSLQSETNCNEWAGSNYINVSGSIADTVNCHTLQNTATHCSLELMITKGKCYALVRLNSVAGNDGELYYCTGGNIRIDREAWEQGFMKAVFDLSFSSMPKEGEPLRWKGTIYAYINP